MEVMIRSGTSGSDGLPGEIFSGPLRVCAAQRGNPMKDSALQKFSSSILLLLFLCAVPGIQSADFKISDDTGTATQSMPAVAMHPHGPAVVCWTDGRSGSRDIYFQMFDRRGRKSGANTRVNDDQTRPAQMTWPSVAMDGNGHFVIGWLSDDTQEVRHAYARLYLADGDPFGGIVLVDDAPADKSVYGLSLAMDRAGNTVAAWTDLRSDPWGDAYARLFRASGQTGPSVMVHAAGDSAQLFPVVSTNRNGDWVVIWEDLRSGESELYARRFRPGGMPKGPEFPVGSHDISTAVGLIAEYDAAVQPNGSFAVCWLEGYSPDKMTGRARLYGASGTPAGPALRVVEEGEFAEIMSPRVAANPGGYVFSWAGSSEVDVNIFARGCDTLAQFTGSGRLVNDLPGIQGFPDAASDVYGSTVLAWMDMREGNADIYGTALHSFRPMHVLAGNGFDGIVPVAWEPYYSQANPCPFKIYRTSSPLVPPILVATVNSSDPWNPTRLYSWVDTTVLNGNHYYYLVTAEYGDRIGTSYISEAVPSAGGHVFASAWTRTAPVIDGRLSEGEWDDAAVLDISNPDAVHRIRLFAKNSGSVLYLAVDDSNDVFVESNTALGFLMDLNHDCEWDAASPSDEGGVTLKQTGATFFAIWGRYPDHLGGDALATAGGIHYLALAGSGHVQHEAAIDLSASPLKAVPGGTIGFGVWTQDPGNFYPNQYGNAGQWPTGLVMLTAKTLGSLTLATETDASGKNPQAPVSFELGQNYPNPFNPSTSVPFRVKEPGRVTLKVYDALGNEAAVLADGFYPAGSHSVRFDAPDLPSGIYVYRIQMGKFAASRKMVKVE
jgi:hypothetical protein